MINLEWVKDYIDISDQDLQELAIKITQAGINIEKVISNHIDYLKVGQVLDCKMHPDSDHLHVTLVDVGEEKPTETVTIPNTANVKINDDFYGSNEVKAYVSMVSAYEVTQTTAVPKTTIFKATKQSKITSVANVAQSTQPYTGSKSRKALIFIFTGVLVGATIGAVYRFRKIKKDGKDIIKINKN